MCVCILCTLHYLVVVCVNIVYIVLRCSGVWLCEYCIRCTMRQWCVYCIECKRVYVVVVCVYILYIVLCCSGECVYCVHCTMLQRCVCILCTLYRVCLTKLLYSTLIAFLQRSPDKQYNAKDIYKEIFSKIVVQDWKLTKI